MNTKRIVVTLVALAVLVVPVVSSANTYQYIDTSGQLQYVQADNSSQALASAYNIGIHSGVMLYSSNWGIGGADYRGDYAGSFY